MKEKELLEAALNIVVQSRLHQSRYIQTDTNDESKNESRARNDGVAEDTLESALNCIKQKNYGEAERLLKPIEPYIKEHRAVDRGEIEYLYGLIGKLTKQDYRNGMKNTTAPFLGSEFLQPNDHRVINPNELLKTCYLLDLSHYEEIGDKRVTPSELKTAKMPLKI